MADDKQNIGPEAPIPDLTAEEVATPEQTHIPADNVIPFGAAGTELLHLMVKSSVAQNKTDRDTIQLDILQRLAK